jgi:hypothetical protein
MEKINYENWCPIHKTIIARNQLECFLCRLEKKMTSILQTDEFKELDPFN